jgi:hypothetical protein
VLELESFDRASHDPPWFRQTAQRHALVASPHGPDVPMALAPAARRSDHSARVPVGKRDLHQVPTEIGWPFAAGRRGARGARLLSLNSEQYSTTTRDAGCGMRNAGCRLCYDPAARAPRSLLQRAGASTASPRTPNNRECSRSR